MIYVMFTAAAIALATLIGTAAGYLLGNIPPRANDAVIGFSSGVMLGAAILGLIVPSVKYGGRLGAVTATAAIFAGALFLYFTDKLSPKFRSAARIKTGDGQSRALLLVAAMAVHHFPEGIAAGVSFGTGDAGDVLLVCGGIAIQNLPEAAVIIVPMLNAGISRKKALVIALISGAAEVIGTFFGYFAVNAATFIMPAALAFAGGCMIYAIIDEMVPETHTHGFGGTATFSALAGFCVMLLLESITDFI